MVRERQEGRGLPFAETLSDLALQRLVLKASQWNRNWNFLRSPSCFCLCLSYLFRTWFVFVYMRVIPISLFAFSHKHFHLHPPSLPSLPLIWQPVGLLPALNTAFPGYSSSVISTLSPHWNYEWKALLFFTNNSGFLSQSNSNGSDCQTKRLYDGQSSQQAIAAHRTF